MGVGSILFIFAGVRGWCRSGWGLQIRLGARGSSLCWQQPHTQQMCKQLRISQFPLHEESGRALGAAIGW